MKLNAAIAVEKGTKTRVYAEVSELYKAIQKPDLFNGFSKTYRPKDDGGEMYPPEARKVQMSVKDVLRKFIDLRTEAFDVTAIKDIGNTSAKANIVVDGTVIATDLPATFLIYLEKQLDEITVFMEALPELSPDEDWREDVNSGMFKTEPMTTHRSKKEQKVVKLAEATKEHPEQAVLVSEDVLVGYWDLVKQSAAMPRPVKEKIIERVNKLRKAVKIAREEANEVEVPGTSIGAQIFQYLLP